MRKFAFAFAASLLAATSANAATFITSTIGSAPAVGSTVIDFDSATPGGFSIAGGMVQAGNNNFGHEPFAGGGNYLTTNNTSGTGSATIFSATGFNEISFDWGSIDTYNNFALLDKNGNAVFTLSGNNVTPHNGVDGFRITLTAETGEGPFYGLRLYSGQPAFEVDNVAFNSAVPEPATWAMMLGGFGLIGAAMRRRKAVRPSVTFA
jgi:hypothetical protein